MDLETNGVGSFLRRHSSSSSNAITPIDDDRDDIMGNGSVVPIPANALATTSFVSPSTLELIPPLSTEAIIHSDDKNQENKRELPWVLDCSSHLIHLAVFGILGVLTRYLLQKLFGPGVIGLTSDQSVLYLDLPSNMVGSFLMGWWGIVFEDDISRVSDSLAVGLTTGYLGSLTTYSGWNQKMLDLSAQGKWVVVVFGFPLGFILADYSIVYGIRTAQSFKRFMGTSNVLPLSELSSSQNNSKVNTNACYTIATGIQFGLLGCLSTVSTFIAEVHLLRESMHPWRGDVYALVTIILSFGLGTLIYSIPVWTQGYD